MLSSLSGSGSFSSFSVTLPLPRGFLGTSTIAMKFLILSPSDPQTSFTSLQNPGQNNDSFETTRVALMESFNAQTTAHGGYILAAVVALVAATPQFRRRQWVWAVIIALILSACVFLMLRTVFWTYLAGDVLSVKGTELAGDDDNPLILRMQSTTIAHFNQNSSLASWHLAYVAGGSSGLPDK